MKGIDFLVTEWAEFEVVETRILEPGEANHVEVGYSDIYGESILKRGDWFSAMTFEGTSITYMGLHMDKINMNKIIGTLR